MKKINKSIFYYILAGIIVIVITSIIIIRQPEPEFNPETDVCTLSIPELKDIANNTIREFECLEWRPFQGELTEKNQEKYCELWQGIYINCFKCYDWQPKNKCELDPNEEGCICDEWEIEECIDSIAYTFLNSYFSQIYSVEKREANNKCNKYRRDNCFKIVFDVNFKGFS